eukprot:scaffold4690_cov116-Cylindrotheca_fusiformis.AAC.13
MLRRIRGNRNDKFYQDLIDKEPHVVSITFWRDDCHLNRPGEEQKVPQRLGIKIDKVPTDDDEQNGGGAASGGDYQISALDDNPDSLLYGMPIEVGDLLVAVNSQSCYGLDIQLLKQMVATQTGIVTLTLRKTRMAPFQDELRLAVFIDSQKHTCIPKDICFFKEQEKLAIFALYDEFDVPQVGNDADNGGKNNGKLKNNKNKNSTTTDKNNSNDDSKNKNEWLESSCLAEGQVVLDINGTPCFHLLEEDALAVMKETLEFDEVLAIKTYAPSRASSVATESVDMVERISSYIVQLQLRMDRSLAQARHDTQVVSLANTITNNNENDPYPYPIWQSAATLERMFAGSYNRCIVVSNAKPLYRLYLVMEDVWTKYAKLLSRKYPLDNRFTRVLRKRLSSPQHQQQQQQAISSNKNQPMGWFPKKQDQLINEAPTKEEIEQVDEEEEKKTAEQDDVKNKNQGETQPAARGRWFFGRRQPPPTTPTEENSANVKNNYQEEEEETTTPTASATRSRWFFSRRTTADNSTPTNSQNPAKDGNENDTDVDVDPLDKEAPSRRIICHVLCTGDYCIRYLKEREEQLREAIDEKFKYQIDFEEAREILQVDVIDKGIPMLVHSVEFQMEPILTQMTRLKWHLWEDVGDTSPYAVELVELLKKRATSLSERLPFYMYQKFKYDLVEAVCEAYYATLIKVHRISPVGTQQLLLDVCTLKDALVGILRINGSINVKSNEDIANTNTTTSTTEIRVDERTAKDPQVYVNELLRTTEALLKLAGTNVGVDDLLIEMEKKQESSFRTFPKGDVEEEKKMDDYPNVADSIPNDGEKQVTSERKSVGTKVSQANVNDTDETRSPATAEENLSPAEESKATETKPSMEEEVVSDEIEPNRGIGEGEKTSKRQPNVMEDTTKTAFAAAIHDDDDCVVHENDDDDDSEEDDSDDEGGEEEESVEGESTILFASGSDELQEIANDMDAQQMWLTEALADVS